MRRTDVMRTLSWLIPVVCFVLAGVMVYLQFRNLEKTRADLAKTTRDVDDLRMQIEKFQLAGGDDRIPFVYDSRQEESQFLDSVRRLALMHKVDLDKYANQTPIAPRNPPPAGQPAPGGPPAAMRNVKTLISAIEVRGNYDAVRAFLSDLLKSERLLAVKSGSWNRGKESAETTFGFQLHRYVSTAPPPIPPVGATAMATKNSAGALP